tara:strand:- start:8288 stop:9010 length:723 start_codon:yes stop_codon:yes gene_type:complete
MTELKDYVIYGSEKIYFELKSKNNNSKSITIKIKPDGLVIISSPKKVTKVQLLNIINKRVEWIYKKRKEFKARYGNIHSLKYISGESHYYLGTKYLLKIIDESSDAKVNLSYNQIEIITNNKKNIKQELANWYKNQALEIFDLRFNELLSKTYWVKNRPNLVLKFMKSQWGSYSSNGNIALNIHLIKTPIECIDYVIFHELCHVLIKNHSKKFYELLEQVCPNWKTMKKYLDQNVYLLIN